MGKILKRIRLIDNITFGFFVAIVNSAIYLLVTGNHAGDIRFGVYWIFGIVLMSILDMISNRNADN